MFGQNYRRGAALGILNSVCCCAIKTSNTISITIFAPNDGSDRVATSTMTDGEILDGQIFITGIWVGDKPRPVSVEILGLMKTAAAREEVNQLHLLRQRLIQAAEHRRAQSSVIPRRG